MGRFEKYNAGLNLAPVFSAGSSYQKIDGGDESGKIRLMEDILCERPFVNLALLESAALDTLQRNSTANLNRSCYYIGDRLKSPCGVGLFKSENGLNLPFKLAPILARQKISALKSC